MFKIILGMAIVSLKVNHTSCVRPEPIIMLLKLSIVLLSNIPKFMLGYVPLAMYFRMQWLLIPNISVSKCHQKLLTPIQLSSTLVV